MVKVGFRKYNLVFVLLEDFTIATFLGFCGSFLSVITLAIFLPLFGYFKGINIQPNSIIVLWAFSFLVVFLYRSIFHLTEEIILNEESIIFKNLFYRDEFNWNAVQGYSKPFYTMEQMGIRRFGLFGYRNALFFEQLKKLGQIPFFLQLWIKTKDGKTTLYQKSISRYNWEPIIEFLEKKFPNPREGQMQTRAHMFSIEPKQLTSTLILGLLILLSNILIYLRFFY